MLDVNVLKFLRGCATETEQSPQCVIQNLQLANLSYPLKSPSDQLPRKKLNNNLIGPPLFFGRCSHA